MVRLGPVRPMVQLRPTGQATAVLPPRLGHRSRPGPRRRGGTAPPPAARAEGAEGPGRRASPAVAREPRAGRRGRPRWPPARPRPVPQARLGPPRRAPQAARAGSPRAQAGSPQARAGPPRRSPPPAVWSLAPRPGPSSSLPGRMMSPRRTTLPELARFPPKVPQLRPSPRFGLTQAAGPEPPDGRPGPPPLAQPQAAPSRPAGALRQAARHRVPRGSRAEPGPPGRWMPGQNGWPGQPLPATDRPMTRLALPATRPRQRAGPLWVQPPMMPADRSSHPPLPGKMPLLEASRQRQRQLVQPPSPPSHWPAPAHPPPWGGSQKRARSAGRRRSQGAEANRRAAAARTATAVDCRPVACCLWSAAFAG